MAAALPPSDRAAGHMEPGNLIEFRLDDRRLLATVDRPEGKKLWIVVDEQGRSYKIRPQDALYHVKGQSYSPQAIAEFRRQVEPFLDPDHLAVAWELLVEDGEATDPSGLAALLFSDQSAPAAYAAHVLLSDDRLYFKQKGDRYEPRPASQVEEIRRQQAAAAAKEREQEEFFALIQRGLQGDRSALVPLSEPPYRSRLDILERYAVYGEELPNKAAAIDLLKTLQRAATDRGAFDLLADVGWWSAHENLFVRRSQLPTRFSAKHLELAQKYLDEPPPDLDQAHRLDLTHLKVYTIDSEDTREIDDGVSLEFLADGRERIWVHIADPTRWLQPGDDLELEARRRSTTVYLPTGAIPMFPLELAAGPMSLIQGKRCASVSFSAILDDEGAIVEAAIHASEIVPTYRLNYDEVDEMLQLAIPAESELQGLARWSKRREAWRRSQGAIRIDMPESSIVVKHDPAAGPDEPAIVDIYVLPDAASRTLVAEMMILAGEIAARYGQTEGIPLPFRSQPQPDLPSDEELLKLPAGPVRSCAIRRCMPRSEMGVIPARHSSLALDGYSQVTSPIRRYTDLLAHFQIKAHLRGDPLPFTSDSLQQIVQVAAATAYESVLVERQTNRYWTLEYFRQHRDRRWDALMLRWLREDDGLGAILIEDLGVELPMRFHRNIEPGESIVVEIGHVDPRQDSIQFREVREVRDQASPEPIDPPTATPTPSIDDPIDDPSAPPSEEA